MCIRDRDYVVKFLAAEYAMDKVGAREALFGNEPKMDDPVTLYEPDDYSNTPKAKPKSPWGIATSKDGSVRVTSGKKEISESRREWRKKRGLNESSGKKYEDYDDSRDWSEQVKRRKKRSLREELEWNRGDYKKPGYKRGKGKGRKR